MNLTALRSLGTGNAEIKKRTESLLEKVPGVGAKRRQALLKYLGGMQEIIRATPDELAKVPGISPALARVIYDTLH